MSTSIKINFCIHTVASDIMNRSNFVTFNNIVFSTQLLQRLALHDEGVAASDDLSRGDDRAAQLVTD
jgi:hypothetical protein